MNRSEFMDYLLEKGECSRFDEHQIDALEQFCFALYENTELDKPAERIAKLELKVCSLDLTKGHLNQCEEALKSRDAKIAELENSWISVEDGLPDELQSVLSFASRDGVSQSIYRAGNFKKSLVVWEHLNVTHWMPLPEPPKEQVK